MADVILPNTGIVAPHVGPGGTGNWGDKLNINWQELDDRFTPTAPAAQTAGAGSTGTSDNVARADHVHPLNFAGGSIPDASIPYVKLDLTGMIVNADVAAAAGIVYSKLNLTGAIVNADVAVAAAIAYTKLNLTGSITNADLAGAIALSKLATLTADRALVSDSSGVISTSSVTSAQILYLAGVTSAIQTQLDGKASLALNNLAATAINVALNPGTTNSIDLGSTSSMWREAFFGTGIRLKENGGTDLYSVKAPAAMPGNLDFILPPTAGSNGQALFTDGAGGTSWNSIPGGGTVNAGGLGQVAYYAAAGTAVSGTAALTTNGSALTATVPLAMGSNKITGLAAATTSGDALRYEQVNGIYLPLAGGTMAGAIAMGSSKITGLAASSANGDATRYEQVKNLWRYRRPVLIYTGASGTGVESGLTGTSGEAAILFPDGDYRVDSNGSRTAFNITRTAVLSGTALSGLRSGLSEATNTWYALYAVKVTDSTTDFCTVGDTVAPTQANYATLNSNFGTNSWVYLGMIANGDGSGVTGDIVNFVMTNDTIRFTNNCALRNRDSSGVRIAHTTSATNLSWTHAVGSALGSGQVPITALIGSFMVSTDVTSSNNMGILASNLSAYYYESAQVAGAGHQYLFSEIPISRGLYISPNATIGMSIALTGFRDVVLGVGPNPGL